MKSPIRHGWIPSDPFQIPCRAEACIYCHEGLCRVPKLCVIGEKGCCTNFTARKKLPDIEEWRP